MRLIINREREAHMQLRHRVKLPKDFNLTESVIDSVSNQNTFNDVILYEDLPLDSVEKVACYRTSNGYYHLFTVDSINALPKNFGIFTCPNTRELINIREVITLEPDELKLAPEKIKERKLEAERKLAAEKAAAEKLAAEEIENDKMEVDEPEVDELPDKKAESEKFEADRLAAEKLEAERIAAEKREVEKREVLRRVDEKNAAERRAIEKEKSNQPKASQASPQAKQTPVPSPKPQVKQVDTAAHVFAPRPKPTFAYQKPQDEDARKYRIAEHGFFRKTPSSKEEKSFQAQDMFVFMLLMRMQMQGHEAQMMQLILLIMLREALRAEIAAQERQQQALYSNFDEEDESQQVASYRRSRR